MTLEPMVDWIGDFPVCHGERDDLDPEHPRACLCGHPDYFMCPEWMGGSSIYGMTIRRRDEGETA